MSTEQKTDLSHAEQNACGWLESIREYAAALSADRKRLEELREERDNYEPACVCDAEEHGPDTCTGNCGCPECWDTWTSIERATQWAEENPDDAQELRDLIEAVTIEGEELDEDQVRERIQESPLSVEVRGGWHAPGAEDDGPEEFMILLSTGGPALRIVGDLDEHCQPTRARLEHQDWFKPWTEYICTGEDHDALMAFVNCFYFGD